MNDQQQLGRSPLPSHRHAQQQDMATRLGSGGGAANLESHFSRASHDDVVFCVGKHRQTYHVNSESLIRSSAFFRNLLALAPQYSMAGAPRPPIVIDCEQGIFESLLLLMRYGTLEALPPMSAAEIFRLTKEADFYGIRYTSEPSKVSREAADDCSSSDLSCSSPISCSSNSTSASPSGSPKSMMNMSPGSGAGKRASHGGRYYEGVRLACSTPRQLAELPEFPLTLADPARLVLVSCLDQEKASIYTCDCTSRSAGISTQWAINFHHRHAFCTACGRAPNLSPKHFAEMFMAAAAYYHAAASPAQAAPMEPNYRAWRVSSDSTCTLRFISSAGDGPDACGCSAGGARAAKEAPPTIWAANCFYSHAFCTCCGEAAKGPVLLSLILALRYGGRSSFRMDSQTHGRPTKSL